MSERPIIFSTDMVRAILDGRKTQTRRIVSIRNTIRSEDTSINYNSEILQVAGERNGYWTFTLDTGSWRSDFVTFRCPFGEVGDRLWVRETFNWSSDADLLPGENHKKCPERGYYSADNAVYRADGERNHPEYGKALWLPSIHMPRYASRITLNVTGVRVERLQDITEDDAEAEGIDGLYDLLGMMIPKIHNVDFYPTRRNGFYWKWQKIYSKSAYPWELNPWVWVVEFERV